MILRGQVSYGFRVSGRSMISIGTKNVALISVKILRPSSFALSSQHSRFYTYLVQGLLDFAGWSIWLGVAVELGL